MSEEQQQPVEPEETPEFDMADVTTPLQDLALEMHEVYESLTGAGFPAQVGAWIIASMMESAMDGVLGGGDLPSVEITLDEDDEGPEGE